MIAHRRLRSYAPASTEWFVETEIKYGGFITDIAMKRRSPFDPGDPSRHGYLRGGDRMAYHGYAGKYSQHTKPHLNEKERIVIIEVGVLTGIGLAMWSDLFPDARVIGFDIDLTHIQGNLANLRNMGAFKQRDPELYEFDQFDSNESYLGDILKGDRAHIVIDDADHSREAILNTMDSLIPHLNQRFVYFIEDNSTILDEIRGRYPEYDVDGSGELTVVSSRERP